MLAVCSYLDLLVEDLLLLLVEDMLLLSVLQESLILLGSIHFLELLTLLLKKPPQNIKSTYKGKSFKLHRKKCWILVMAAILFSFPFVIADGTNGVVCLLRK